MDNIFKEWKEVSILVNPIGKEQALIDFLKERNIAAERSIVVEPADMFTIAVSRGLTFRALEYNLHVDFDEENPKNLLIFSSDKRQLENFLIQYSLNDVPVVRGDGETDVKYTCRRLSKREEILAMKAGLLVGRVDYLP